MNDMRQRSQLAACRSVSQLCHRVHQSHIHTHSLMKENVKKSKNCRSLCQKNVWLNFDAPFLPVTKYNCKNNEWWCAALRSFACDYRVKALSVALRISRRCFAGLSSAAHTPFLDNISSATDSEHNASGQISTKVELTWTLNMQGTAMWLGAAIRMTVPTLPAGQIIDITEKRTKKKNRS